MPFSENRIIAVIPARGGSKRIPRKNIRIFNGKPIIAYSIEAAINSGIFDEVMVSTDDQEISEIAQLYGATVPFLRSKETSNDYATIIQVIFEVLNQYEKMGKNFTEVSCIFATAPFVTAKDLHQAFQLFKNEEVDGIFSVLKFSFPILRALEKNKDGFLHMKWPEYINTRSQDLNACYHDAGQFYFAKKEALLESQSFFTKRVKGLELNQWQAVDIDTEEDWTKAEKLYQLRTDSL